MTEFTCAEPNQLDLAEGKRAFVLPYVRYRLSKTKLRVPLIRFRHRNFRPADVFFGSYPRSGSTWARFTLYEALTGKEATFDAVNWGLPGVGGQRKAVSVLPGEGRLIQTHERYRREYQKAIYLVRDPRDVVISEHAYLKGLDFFRGTLDQFIADFVRGKVNGFGAWQDHVTSWLDSPLSRNGQLLLIHYKDLRQQPEKGFAHILEFLGVEVDPGIIRRAVVNNSLEKMRSKEDRAPRVAVRLPKPKNRVVRTGLVEGWRAKLSPSQLDPIERHAADVLMRLGYSLARLSLAGEPNGASVLQQDSRNQ